MLLNMKTRRPWKRSVARVLRGTSAAVLALACTAVQAASVSYETTDLPDMVAGQDRWQLDYTVAGTLDDFESVNLLFAPGRYASPRVLGLTPTDSLDILSIAGDVLAGTDAQLILTKLPGRPGSFSARVSVELTWLGQAPPGSQPYEWLDDGFNVKASGLTTPALSVPEASTMVLALVGIGLVGMRHRRGRRTAPGPVGG